MLNGRSIRCYVALLVLMIWTTLAAAQVPAQTAGFSLAQATAGPAEKIDATYQWSIAMPSPQFERRAYLWVPPHCTRVRGVVVGIQNMLEKLMFQNGDFRDACAEAGLAIVYIAPGSTTTDKSKEVALSLSFKEPAAGVAQLNQLLTDFATLSGYSEIATVPLVPVGHSAATPFVWGLAKVQADRCLACIPYKGWFSGASERVPYLHVSSEWAEVGGPNWGSTGFVKDRASVLKVRSHDKAPLGEYIEVGTGHFAWPTESGRILGLFLKKVTAARTINGSGALKPLPIESGVLVDAAGLGTPQFRVYSYDSYPGDKDAAFWYVDAEMAQQINDAMASKLAKKPQVIDMLVKGTPAPLDKRGMAEERPALLPDGVTWKVQAGFLDHAPPQLNYGDGPMGHAEGGIYFRATSGAIKQTGVDTFRVWLGRGGIEHQGNPWDPWIIATSDGDAHYRSADRPYHVLIDILRKDGKPQSISFPEIPAVTRATHSIQLHATADSGLPVQYFVISGPVDISEDGKVTFLAIPPRTRFPARVLIGAYQWGRGLEPKIASAPLVTREFLINQ